MTGIAEVDALAAKGSKRKADEVDVKDQEDDGTKQKRVMFDNGKYWMGGSTDFFQHYDRKISHTVTRGDELTDSYGICLLLNASSLA